MAISNLTQGLRPGVCTSTTRPTAPYEGQMIYETDTNRVLVWDNAAWVMIADTDQPPGLQLVKTQTVGTTVSTVTVSDAFSSEFENYFVTYSGGTSSTTTNISFQLGTTNTGYYGQLLYAQYSSTSPLALVPDNNGTQFTRFGNANTTFTHLNANINMPFATTRTTVNSQWITPIQSGNYQGFLDNATSYTSFTIFPVSGTLTGGTIRVYGYRN